MWMIFTISFSSEINECLSQPCMNGGTCRDRVASYLCECEDGFTGQRCQTGNLSYFILTFRYYRFWHLRVWKCGFSLDFCDVLTDIDECLSEPCKHGGTCEDQPGSYFCHCQKGYAGQDCEIGNIIRIVLTILDSWFAVLLSQTCGLSLAFLPLINRKRLFNFKMKTDLYRVI